MSIIEETNKIIESAGNIIEQHTIKAEALVKGKTYKAARDILFAELDDVDYLEPDDLKKFKAKGYIKGKNIIFPKGTPIKFVGNFGGAYSFNVAGVDIDMLLDDNMLEAVTKSNYKAIISTLEGIIKKAAKANKDAQLVSNYKATTGSNGIKYDLALHFKSQSDIAKANKVSDEMKSVMKKYGYHEGHGSLNFVGDNNKQYIFFGSTLQGDNGCSVGYYVNADFDINALESDTHEAMPPKSQRKRIDFEDDLVKVYQGNKEIYSGIEDYEPMKDANWKWDNNDKCYKYDKYIKICVESLNEDFKKPVNAEDFKVGELYQLVDGNDVFKVIEVKNNAVYINYVSGKFANKGTTYYLNHPEINYKNTKWVDKKKFYANTIKDLETQIKYKEKELAELKKKLADILKDSK